MQQKELQDTINDCALSAGTELKGDQDECGTMIILQKLSFQQI